MKTINNLVETDRLPSSLQIHNRPVAEALTALATRLLELAEQMPMVTDIDVTVTIDPDGKSCLHFRACR